MKKNIIIIFSLFILNNFYGQNRFNHISYKVDRYNKAEKIKKSKNNQVNLLMQKIIAISDIMRFELIFNKEKSLFKRKEMIIPEKEEMIYKMASHGVYEGVYYFKNQKIKYEFQEFLGDAFNIIYPYDQYKWKITKETKIIQGYKCYKATTTWEEYDYGREINLKFNPVVWFTYDLPYPFGPKGLDGLPGVVLEGSINGVTYFKASKIEMDKNIKFPKTPKGKQISYTDYFKLIGEDFKMKRGRK